MDSPGTVFPQPSFFLTNILRFVAVLILAAALLAPIWSTAFPPLLDYPNHLARSFVLAHLGDPAFAFSGFYRADWGAYPYLGMDASLAVLGRLFSIETAGRVFLSLCALALPGAAWFFLRQVNPGEDATALWALLIACNVFFLEGFLNFDLSLAVGFLALGFWLRWLSKHNIARWVAALAPFTALYFTHLLGFGIAGLVVVAYLAFTRRPLRDWIWSGALALPGVAFYLHSSRVGLSAQKIVFHGFEEKLDSIGTILHGYSPMLDLISLAAGRVVSGSLVAQSGVSLEWPLAGNCCVPLCPVLGDSLDVGRGLGSRYSRVACIVRRDLCGGARGKACEMAGCDSASSLCRTDGEHDATFCRSADGTRRPRAFF